MRSLTGFVPLLLIVAVFYFLVIRPQRSKQRQQQSLVNALVPGQRVVTTAGMFATVVSVEDGEVVLEQSPGVQARFVKQAVGRVVDDGTAALADAETAGEDTAADYSYDAPADTAADSPADTRAGTSAR